MTEKKEKPTAVEKKKEEKKEEERIDLGGKKFVQVSEFKGKPLVQIREFYEDKASALEKRELHSPWTSTGNSRRLFQISITSSLFWKCRNLSLEYSILPP